jgi:hypothetical protein
MIAIEKGVPLPAPRVGRPTIYPFANMVAGDSFFVTVPEADRKRLYTTLRTSVRDWRARHGGKFAIRTIKAPESGLRVWRIA